MPPPEFPVPPENWGWSGTSASGPWSEPAGRSRRGTSASPLIRTSFISLNLSEDQLCDPNFADDIHRVLDETGIAPRLLCLEVNEGTIINDPEEVAITMVKLKEMGVRIAMDNFGTGHSSLNCLHEFPFHLLKIDRSIIATDDHRKRPSQPSCTP